MAAQMVRQFGLETGALLEATPEVVHDLDYKTCNVFFMPDAQISRCTTEQAEFVVPFLVKSALGFGGVLPPETCSE